MAVEHGTKIVLQSRLFRTPDDIVRLGSSSKGLSVRLVKGIYLEPPQVAHTDHEAIRKSFVQCAQLLLERGARVSFATHDDRMEQDLFALVRRYELGRDDYEFQVLLGVRRQLWERWRNAGHVVRVYVPYGPEWLPYTLRRLKHNPEILRHVVRALFSGG